MAESGASHTGHSILEQNEWMKSMFASKPGNIPVASPPPSSDEEESLDSDDSHSAEKRIRFHPHPQLKPSRPPIHPCHYVPRDRPAPTIARKDLKIRKVLLETVEAVTTAIASRALAGWKELSDAMRELKLGSRQDLLEGLHGGSVHDVVYVMLLVHIQDQLIDISTSYRHDKKSRARLSKDEARSQVQFFSQLDVAAKSPVWGQLQRISYNCPSPASIYPPNPPQSPFLIHRLLTHLLSPFDISSPHNHNTYNILDLTNLQANPQAENVEQETQAWLDFRWVGWLRWLAGMDLELELGEVSGRSRRAGKGKKRESTGTVGSLMGEFGCMFQHVCMQGSKMTSIPAELFSLLLCDKFSVCEPYPDLTSSNRAIFPAIAARLGMITDTFAGNDKPAQPSLSRAYISSSEARLKPAIPMGPPSLVNIVLDRIRVEANPPARYHNSLVTAGEIARAISASNHKHNKQQALRQDYDLDPSVYFTDPSISPFQALSALTGVPHHLLLNIAYSFRCGGCGALTRAVGPGSFPVDYALGYRKMPLRQTGEGGKELEVAGVRYVIAGRICGSCLASRISHRG